MRMPYARYLLLAMALIACCSAVIVTMLPDEAAGAPATSTV